MTNSIKLIFNRYKLVYSSLLFEIFLGKNEKEQDSILFRVNLPFPESLLSELINTSIMVIDLIQKEKTKTILCFDLLDANYQALFFSFADNIIKFVCTPSNQNKPFEAIVLRYSQWQRLLKINNTGLLSVESIRGLIGELLFLKDYLIPQFGPQIAIRYWKGPLGADQDFKTENIWYEIKTITSGNDTILVSSLEQLDSERFGDGEIVIFALDVTTATDPEAIKIGNLIQEIKLQLNDQEAYQLDNFLFTNLSYYNRPEYKTGNYVVRHSSTQRYVINNSSPVIRKSTVPSSVISLKYNLSLSSLNAFKVE